MLAVFCKELQQFICNTFRLLFCEVVATFVNHYRAHSGSKRSNLSLEVSSKTCGPTDGQDGHPQLLFGVLPILFCIDLVSAEVSDSRS